MPFLATNTGPQSSRRRGREAFIAGAVAVVARDGLDALTTRSVVRETGASQGSMQHYFPTMNDLVVAALHHCVEVTIDYIHRSPGALGILDSVLHMLHDQPDTAVFQTEVFLRARLRPELMNEVTRIQREYEQAAALALGRHYDAKTAAAITSLLATVADGLTYQYAVFGRTRLEALTHQVHVVTGLLGAMQH